MFMRMRQSVFIVLVLVFALAVAACGTQPQDDEGRPTTYGHDGYMGLSNSNPGLPRNSAYRSYSSDIRFMQEKLEELGGIRHAAFRIQDPDIYVQLTVASEVTEEQAAELTAQAHQMLADNMPRYVIHMEPYKTER
ncbi:hypothetical protein [Paenibacillus sp. 1P07SE]|uniref:hypothetical protein n=1 Tax=Paenibacillus sp. 1P07SE TaxID=3132209 RepID=UPI0039A62CED